MRKILPLVLLFTFFTSYAVKHRAGGDSDYQESSDATHFPAMILVEEDEDIDEIIDELESQGITVLHHRHNILLTLIPIDWEENSAKGVRGGKFAKNDPIIKIERSKPRTIKPQMDQARLFNNANFINEGLDLPQPFTGKGVVVGVCDIGFDTRHPNFLNADQTECRIRRVTQYKEQEGSREVYTSPKEIYDWQTDNSDDWHATHVVGIAAGAHKESGYYSLAYDADIVFSASQLSDVGLLAGVEDIIEYAKEVGKPAVINLSMGNYTGPHDGSSLFTQYLDYCADDAIICISAGNEGNVARAMKYDFSEENTEFRVLPNNWHGMEISGYTDVWSADDTPFDFFFYWNNNSSLSKNLDAYPALRATPGENVEWSISLNPEDPDYDETFASLYYEGYVRAEAGVSPLNGRYYVSLAFDLKTNIYHGNTGWSEWWPGIKVSGDPGTHVDIYCGGDSFLRQERGNPIPDNDMNISDLATGFRTISVGMMNNTDTYASPEDNVYGYAKGEVSINSSYGTLLDGRKLPVTVAPGSYVISSISSPFLENNPDFIQYTDYSTDYNGKTVYWIGTDGTSMSCPYVVGAIATWLQAYPQLSADKALEIVKATNQTEGYPKPEDPRHGQGWFKAYDGMLEVLELAKLSVSAIEDSETAFRFENGMILIGNPSGIKQTLNIYDTTGMLVERATIGGSITSHSLTHLPKGVYIVRMDKQTIKIAL